MKADQQRLGEIALHIDEQINAILPGHDCKVEQNAELCGLLTEAYVKVRQAQQWMLKDKQRRVEELARTPPVTRVVEESPKCNCYGSMFSHDVDCATNLHRMKLAGYELRKL